MTDLLMFLFLVPTALLVPFGIYVVVALIVEYFTEVKRS